jgi:hypothetical protein
MTQQRVTCFDLTKEERNSNSHPRVSRAPLSPLMKLGIAGLLAVIYVHEIFWRRPHACLLKSQFGSAAGLAEKCYERRNQLKTIAA